MKGDPKVIADLQKFLAMEIQLSAQYALDARTLRDLGLKSLGKRICNFGDDCEDYVKKLSKRLLFFGVKPEYSLTLTVQTNDNLTGMFQAALDAEAEIVAAYNDAAIVAMNAKDDNTRNLFEHLIKFHEMNHSGKTGGAHIDWLQRKLAQIAEYGEKEFRLEHI